MADQEALMEYLRRRGIKHPGFPDMQSVTDAGEDVSNAAGRAHRWMKEDVLGAPPAGVIHGSDRYDQSQWNDTREQVDPNDPMLHPVIRQFNNSQMGPSDNPMLHPIFKLMELREQNANSRGDINTPQDAGRYLMEGARAGVNTQPADPPPPHYMDDTSQMAMNAMSLGAGGHEAYPPAGQRDLTGGLPEMAMNAMSLGAGGHEYQPPDRNLLAEAKRMIQQSSQSGPEMLDMARGNRIGTATNPTPQTGNRGLIDAIMDLMSAREGSGQ